MDILSDVHLEFGRWPKSIDVNAIDCDAHVLAGDISVGLQGVVWALESFERPVIYVCGNHEFWGQRPMAELIAEIEAKTANTHVHFLNGNSWTLGDVTFVGGTLWTDYCIHGADRQDEMMAYCRGAIGDYAQITTGYFNGYGKNRRVLVSPRALLVEHHRLRDVLERSLPFYREHDFIQQKRRIVVVTHHAPSARSLLEGKPTYTSDAGYASDLDYLVARSDLWVHGHVHISHDYVVDNLRRAGNGRVVCNPRGYVGCELNASYNPRLVVEV